MSRLTGLPLSVKILGATAAPQWAILACTCAGIWAPPDAMLHLVQPGAATETIAALIFWAIARSNERERRMHERLREMQERERVLIRVIDAMDAERPSPPLAAVP